MTKTPYAWARAFPTVFIPSYVEFNGKYQWMIFNDITGFPYPREKAASINKWYEHLMWRSDGIPASHPTFSIVLYNHKIKSSLQKQGQYVVNISSVDPSVTVNDIKQAKDSDALKKQSAALFKQAHLHASNVPGTNSYWRGTRFEFKAANFYNSYINKREISLFHTGSLAEFHEHPLRYLLHNYTAKLNGLPDGYSDAILSNDDTFIDAVQKYKTVVTHYLAAKMEIWMGHFMKPVYEVDGGQLVFEFAKSRGAIHFHSLLTSKHKVFDDIATDLQNLSESMFYAMENVNEHCMDKYDPDIHKERFPVSPELVTSSKTGEKVRQKFCKLSSEGEKVWKDYIESKDKHIKDAASSIAATIEDEFGVNALHSGNFPKDWVKPGGLEVDNYRTTMKGMQSSEDIVKKGELKIPKHKRENDLFDRLVNVTNNARTHKCSAYCWKPKKFSQKYDEKIHKKLAQTTAT